MVALTLLNFSRVSTDGTWENIRTGKEVSLDIGENKIGSDGNCAFMIIGSEGWQSYYCETTGRPSITCACQHQEQMFLQLRGLCSSSNIDQFYVPRNKEKTGAIILLGLTNTIIEYDERELSWSLRGYTSNDKEKMHLVDVVQTYLRFVS